MSVVKHVVRSLLAPTLPIAVVRLSVPNGALEGFNLRKSLRLHRIRPTRKSTRTHPSLRRKSSVRAVWPWLAPTTGTAAPTLLGGPPRRPRFSGVVSPRQRPGPTASGGGQPRTGRARRRRGSAARRVHLRGVLLAELFSRPRHVAGARPHTLTGGAAAAAWLGSGGCPCLGFSAW